MSDPTRGCLAAWLALVAIGCAGGSGGGGKIHGADFPSQQEVKSIEAAPPPSAVFDADLRYVEEWTLTAAAPDRIEAKRWTARSPWGDLLDEATQAAGGLPTEAMHCVANEVGRFMLEHAGQPDVSVRHFIQAGCRASAADASFRLLRGEVGADEDEAAVFERWRADAGSMVRSAIAEGPRSILGIGFERRGDQAILVVTQADARVEIEPVETRLAPGQPFELRGRVLSPADSIEAAINRGRYGVAMCDPVGDAKPPAFHFRCQPDPADASAWVSLWFAPPRRVLGEGALDALVSPSGAEHRTWRRFEYTSARRVADAASFTPAFLEDLNGVRARAGLPPVDLDPAQSETAARVAPHFFAAGIGAVDERVADVVALGLMAGWDVQGDIRVGSFTSSAVAETDDLAALLGAALEEPVARLTLLDADIQRVAVGPIVDEVGEMQVLAAVVAGYAMFDPGTKGADADALFERLIEVRRERGLRPPSRLVSVWMDAMAAADEIARGESGTRALDDLLQESAQALVREVHGWYGETSELAEFEFPEEVVSAPGLGVAIGVSHRKPEDEAWGRYAVVFVTTSH